MNVEHTPFVKFNGQTIMKCLNLADEHIHVPEDFVVPKHGWFLYAIKLINSAQTLGTIEIWLLKEIHGEYRFVERRVMRDRDGTLWFMIKRGLKWFCDSKICQASFYKHKQEKGCLKTVTLVWHKYGP